MTNGNFFFAATATVSVAKPRIIGENDEPLNLSPENETDDFWHTSVGKFRFNIEDLPEQLQYIHKLLKVGNRFRIVGFEILKNRLNLFNSDRRS